jgi:hypothetical protein
VCSRCCREVRVAPTDSLARCGPHLYLLLLVVPGPIGVGTAVFCADRLALTPVDQKLVVGLEMHYGRLPPYGGGCTDVETSREMDMATGACSLCSERWSGGWYYSQDGVDSGVEGGVPALSPFEYVGRLDPIG